jgi:N6-adenosine-specific RNA methylase IME4
MDRGFLWTTGPFIEDAYYLIREWGFIPITMLAWVKCTEITAPHEAYALDPGQPGVPGSFKPAYGVGYWFRGCVEPIIVFKAPGTPSVRTPFQGLLSPNGKHSRKPDSLHQIIESTDEKTGEPLFPGPRIELFGRRARPGWTVLGNQAPGDNLDIRVSIKNYLDSMEPICDGNGDGNLARREIPYETDPQTSNPFEE